MIEIDLTESARETDDDLTLEKNIEKLCKLIICDAERRGADQIRIEPAQIQGENETAAIPGSVLVRIEGQYYLILNVPKKLFAGVMTTLRNWAQLGIAETNCPQFGAFTVIIKFDNKTKMVRYLLEAFSGPNGETLAVTKQHLH